MPRGATPCLPLGGVPSRAACGARGRDDRPQPTPAAGRHGARRLTIGIAALLLLSGCENWGRKEPPPEPPPALRSARLNDPLWAGTVGAETIPANVQVQPLRGFGLVVGLNGRGSSDCPSVIREYLVENLSKEMGPQGSPQRRRAPSPGELIDSLDTAVVEVTGVVPAGARKGLRFDLQVSALAGTSTQSLEGGLLLPTAMRYFDRAASGQGLIAGAVLAEGSGPLFVNPFAEGSSATTEAALRQGSVLGGGRAAEDRPVRLMLLRPNYQLAKAIERRINERFGQRPPAAEAMSAGYVELRTPPALVREPHRFLELVTQVYVDNRPPVVESRLRELTAAAIARPTDLARIATTWEAAGRGIVPHIETLYTHADAAVRFYAARTGLRLRDVGALPVLGALAARGEPSLRLLAVRELGGHTSPQVATYVAPLLNDGDAAVRVAAYEALLQQGDPKIHSVTFRHILDPTQINFILDVVDSEGPALIHVRRTRLPRIAVFGPRTPVVPPVFYSDADDFATVHTADGSSDVRLYAKRGGRMSDQITVPPRVVDLIAALGDLPGRLDSGELRGLGLPYSRVIRILAALCEDETIPAKLVLEQTSLAELLGPETTPERPEAEPDEAPAPAPDSPPEEPPRSR